MSVLISIFSLSIFSISVSKYFSTNNYSFISFSLYISFFRSTFINNFQLIFNKYCHKICLSIFLFYHKWQILGFGKIFQKWPFFEKYFVTWENSSKMAIFQKIFCDPGKYFKNVHFSKKYFVTWENSSKMAIFQKWPFFEKYFVVLK